MRTKNDDRYEPRRPSRTGPFVALFLALSLTACSGDDVSGNNANNFNNSSNADAAADAQNDRPDGGSASDADTDPDPDADTDADTEPAPLATLSLNIFSIDGTPVESANVSLAQTNKATDANGKVSFEELDEGRAVALIEAAGFAPANAVVDLVGGVDSTRTVHLLETGAPHPFDPTTDSEIYEDRVHVTIPANALEDANGDDYTGMAQALITPLNPSTEERAGMPGPLDGILEGDTEPTPMVSVFMANIQLQTDTGEPLSLKDGMSATLEFVLPDDLQEDFAVGDQIEGYWYDTAQGLWIQEGMGDVIDSTYAAGKKAWSFEASHFTWWNCDQPWYDKECLQVSVIDEVTGDPVQGAAIYVEGVSYNGTSYGGTGTSGTSCIDFKLGSTANVSAEGPNGLPQIGPPVEVTGNGTAATCDGQGEGSCQDVVITVASPACVSGTIVDSDGNPLEGAQVYGYYAQNLATQSASATTDANGDYCVSAPRNADVTIIANYDDGTNLLSASTEVTTEDEAQSCSAGNCTDVAALALEESQTGCVSGQVLVSDAVTPNGGPASAGTKVYALEGFPGDGFGGDFQIDCDIPAEDWGNLLGETTTNSNGEFCVDVPIIANEMSLVVGKCDATIGARCLRTERGVMVQQPGTCADGGCVSLADPLYIAECGEGP